MRRITFLIAICLGCAFTKGADLPAPSIAEISLRTTKAGIQARFGPPAHVRQQRSFQIWDYALGSTDLNDLGFAWGFYFDEPSGQLTAVTHNLEKATPVMDLFPVGASHAVTSPGPTPTQVRYRVLDSERVLIAVGLSSPADLCDQVILMRKSAVQFFYPWLSAQLQSAK
jgi:hypothetical protein